VVPVAIDAQPLTRLIVAVPATGAAIFGSRGIFELGPFGETEHVGDAATRASLAIGLGAPASSPLRPL
jgi:hypothetical protein